MNTGILLASGSGERFKDSVPKQFVKLAGLPLLVHTLTVFQNCRSIDQLVVVTNDDYVDQVWEYVNHYNISKVARVVIGGETRQASSKIGLDCCHPDTDYVFIHDGVRPFVTDKIIKDLEAAVTLHKAVDTVIPSADTIVQIRPDFFIDHIPERTLLRRGQTPQAFAYDLIRRAHQKAGQSDLFNATDDCALVLNIGHPVYTVQGDEQNIKVTYPIDLQVADKLFQLRNKYLFQNQDHDLSKVFENKVIVIIGGTSGIGKALSNLLNPLAKAVYPLGRKTDIPINIKSLDSIKTAMNTIFLQENRIDFIINCAGDLIRKTVEHTDLTEWQHIFDTNLTGNFLLAKATLPIFKQQKFGNLLFVGSSSYTRGRSGYSAYCSSKAALVNFCQAFAEEVGEFNIQVNLVSPSRVETPLRYRSFGKEDEKTLLKPDYVAQKIVDAMLTRTTGSVFEIS